MKTLYMIGGTMGIGKTSVCQQLKLSNQGETKEKIIELIRSDPHITQKEMCEALGLSQGGIEYQIRNLKQKGLIKRVGGDRSGYWEVVK